LYPSYLYSYLTSTSATGEAKMSTNYFNRIGGANDGMSGAGLDQIVENLESDFGLTGSISKEDLSAGVSAAKSLNAIIADAIQATGAGAGGIFTVDDVVALNGYIQASHLDTWNQLYGSDANGVETGYQLLLNEGASSWGSRSQAIAS
jgi:hypothetical protein